MSWNYRVMRHGNNNGDYYAIHEVYYDQNGKPRNWTDDDVGPCGESLDEVKACLELMKEALSKPILDYANGKEIV